MDLTAKHSDMGYRELLPWSHHYFKETVPHMYGCLNASFCFLALPSQRPRFWSMARNVWLWSLAFGEKEDKSWVGSFRSPKCATQSPSLPIQFHCLTQQMVQSSSKVVWANSDCYILGFHDSSYLKCPLPLSKLALAQLSDLGFCSGNYSLYGQLRHQSSSQFSFVVDNKCGETGLGDLEKFGKEMASQQEKFYQEEITIMPFSCSPLKKKELNHHLLAVVHYFQLYIIENEKVLKVWTLVIKFELDGIFVILNAWILRGKNCVMLLAK